MLRVNFIVSYGVWEEEKGYRDSFCGGMMRDGSIEKWRAAALEKQFDDVFSVRRFEGFLIRTAGKSEVW